MNISQCLLKCTLFLGLLGTLACCGSAPQDNDLSVSSPDGQVRVKVLLLDEGTPHYTAAYKQQTILAPSRLGFVFKDRPPLNPTLKTHTHSSTLLLGFVFKDRPPLNRHLIVTQVEHSDFDETWEQPWGEVQTIRNHYREMRVHLQEDSGLARQFILTVRVFNDGFGLRYTLPDQPHLKDFQIVDEQTEFAFTADHAAWWIPAFRERRYEYLYERSPLSSLKKVHTPLTLEVVDGDLYLSIHEANLTDYAAMTLAGDGSHTLKCELVPWREDGVKVKATTPHQTPWRTVQIAETPGDLITSYLILNLNEPNGLGDVSWVKPGKYVGIWWAIHLGYYTWPPAATRPFDSARQPPWICPL